MSPYIVQPGREVHAGNVYRSGACLPGAKGQHADLEADGAVAWQDAPVREPRPKPAPKPAAKRKAVN